jgi:peroxiredoxin
LRYLVQRQLSSVRWPLLLGVALLFPLLSTAPGRGIGTTSPLFAKDPGTDPGISPRIGQLPESRLAQQNLRTLDGREVNLQAMRGHVVVLNFFAIWCGYCRRQVAALARYGEPEYREGLRIIGLSIQDASSSPRQVEEFVRRQGLSYPVGFIPDRLFGRFVASKDVSVPQTLVYGRDGRLAGHFQGFDAQVADRMTTVIAAELAKE